MNASAYYEWVISDYNGKTRGDYVDAICPICGKRKLSFHLSDGNALAFKCWLGCDKSEILRCTGREFRDCFIGKPPERPKQEITARYKYVDEGGKLLYEKVRLEPGFNGSSKTFQIRRPLPDGQWAYGLKAGLYDCKKEGGRFLYRGSTGIELPECRRVLYNLPEVISSTRRQVVLCAGEKDSDTMAALGFVSTTCDRGETAGWNDEWSSIFQGRHVTVIEDADEAGKKFAHLVVGSMLDAGVSFVRRVRLPYKDVTRFVSELKASGVRDKVKLRSAVIEQINKGKAWQQKN